LRFGVGFATDFRSDNPFNVLASYRRTWLNRLGEWLTEAQVGSDPRLFTELFQPVHLVCGLDIPGASTFLGPAFLGLGYGEGGRTSVYLLLGIP
jgi:hypothetical protein